jgi:hypothetical protein
VDFPTEGRQTPVRAAADGEIARVRVSGEGYRRALHLKVADGREVVYACLDAFLPLVEDSCLVLQERSGSYELDWRPPAGCFPVAQGGVIGSAGDPGDRRHFLHVEVRVDGTPQDPWNEGLRWDDLDPPRVDAIEIRPLSPDARIDGAWKSRVVTAPEERSGRSGPSRVRAWGTIGVEAHARDGPGTAPHAPQRVKLLLDGAVWFELSLGERVAQGLWDPELPDPRPEGPLRQLLYGEAAGDPGRLACGTRVAPGLHTLRVLASDAVGQADSMEVLLDVRPGPRLQEWMARPLADGAWDVALRFGPAAAGDPAKLRVWVDLTEDGRIYPTHEPVGYLDDGWFVGEISSPRPRGNLGLRVRVLAPDGSEVWEPTVNVDPARRCVGLPKQAPRLKAHASALEISIDPRCVPARRPRAVLEVVEEEIPCALMEDPPGQREESSWRFVAAASPSAPSGVAPVVWVEVDSTHTAWRLSNVFSARPSSDLLWASPDSALTVEGEAGTFNAPQWVLVSREERPGSRVPAEEVEPARAPTSESVEVLIMRSDLFRLDPAELATRGPLRLRLRPRARPAGAEEAARIAVYGRSDASRTWQMRGGVWNGREIVTVVDRLEEWILLEDRTEPWLYGLSPAPGEQLVSSPPALSLQVREQGSGMSAAGFTMLLDHRRVPAAWDPIARSLTATLRAPLKPGQYRWEVRAHDRAGNDARRVAEFRVLGGP